MSLRRRLLARAAVAIVNRQHNITVEQLRSVAGPPPKRRESVAGVTVSPEVLGGRPGELLEPGDAERGAGLFVHGGGFIAGCPEHFRKLFGVTSREAGLRGHAVSYRLAPEHPFPAALDDLEAAYRDLLARGEDPARLVVAGESAGGGLALALALRVRDAGLPLPAALVLWWPFVDLTMSATSIGANRGKDFITPQLVRLSAESYLGGADPRAPLASPLFADLAGLPPTYVQVGSLDLIVDDGRRLASALAAAGVETALDEVAGQRHAFAAPGDDLPESRAALDRVAAWLRLRLPAYEAAIRASSPST